MAISHDYSLLDPNTIQIIRDDRQRKAIDASDLLDSIRTRGVIHPIIITRELVLVAGERRLAACKTLGISVPVRFADELDPIESQIIELEENLKRADLPWTDYVQAISRIHVLYTNQDPEWSHKDTAESLGVARETISKILRVGQDIDSPKLTAATGWVSAYNILSRMDERKTASAMAEILETGTSFFEDAPVDTVKPPSQAPSQVIPILLEDFLTWAPCYAGPRFNLLHCDFPYGIDVFGGTQGATQRNDTYQDTPDTYWTLLGCLCKNLDHILGHSAHVVFWFSMKHYSATLAFFAENAPQLEFNPMPYVWVKSDNMGIIPVPGWTPRQVYETALIGRRGDRPLAKTISNAHYSPTNKSLHPSTKPEPMLRHLLSGFVDETTLMLDPTCGGGGAIRVAEELGAKFVLGLEHNPEYHEIATTETRKFRSLRAVAAA